MVIHGVCFVQGASLAASEHSGSISGEHLGGGGDGYEAPSSPFDALFGKVGPPFCYCFGSGSTNIVCQSLSMTLFLLV